MRVAQPSWKLEQAARDYALKKGEETAWAYGASSYPVDPFKIIYEERELIHVEGTDFGDAFDGRLNFVGPRFLLCYNTKYNAWPHAGRHHPKVRFSVGHELGHYFIDAHRSYLVRKGAPHGSHAEFESNELVERQADCFSAGLLMPRYLLGPVVNQEPEPSLDALWEAARQFDVSCTAMAVRWTQLSHFPCATICVRNGSIQWGFVSEGFRRAGLYRARRNQPIRSKSAGTFLDLDRGLAAFRVSQGMGLSGHWLEGNADGIPVTEYYMAIPYSSCMLVFLQADEDDFPDAWDD